MRKIIALGIMLLFLVMTISSTIGFNSESQSIKPLSNGNILYVGGSGSSNYTKIQDAVDNASNGDTVFVYDDSSPYNENVNVSKSISLIGEDRDTTIIDGNNSGNIIIS
jgi:pectin methylesterase-like acyl-CoA thioesterase